MCAGPVQQVCTHQATGRREPDRPMRGDSKICTRECANGVSTGTGTIRRPSRLTRSVRNTEWPELFAAAGLTTAGKMCGERFSTPHQAVLQSLLGLAPITTTPRQTPVITILVSVYLWGRCQAPVRLPISHRMFSRVSSRTRAL